MRRVLPLVASSLFLLVGGALPVGTARAEDSPDAPDAPAAKAKKEFDDDKIFADWKLCKSRGVAHCKRRGEFWAGKGVTGKDVVWLGLMYARADEPAKAIETLNQFLAWAPPAADDPSVKNRPAAWTALIDQLFKSRQYPKVLETAEKFRAEQTDLPANVIAQYGWQIPGHAARLSGDEPKAIELFTKAGELKFLGGILDLVDVHLAAGRVEEAKKALTTLSEGLEKGQKEVEWMKGFLDAVGTPGPALGEGKNISLSDAPAEWDRANILFLWGMQTPAADRSLRNLELMRKAQPEGVLVLGVATYKQYNPITSKVEADMTEDKEIELYKKMITDTFLTPTPPSIVVKQAWLDAAKLKWDRQFLILDKEGKIRYARLNSEKDWDFLSVEQAAKNIGITK